VLSVASADLAEAAEVLAAALVGPRTAPEAVPVPVAVAEVPPRPDLTWPMPRPSPGLERKLEASFL